MQNTLNSKEEVKKAFKTLLSVRKADRKKIATKEEQALLEQKKKMVAVASEYTPSTIVKTAAELQLDFGETVEKLTDKLKDELTKLDQLRSAITVEHENQKDVQDTRIAANALFILKQEQEQELKQFEEAAAEKMAKLDEEMAKVREQWAKDAEDFEQEVKEYTEKLEKDRIAELEVYKYNLERKYKLDQDANEQKKKFLIRSLEEKLQEKQKDWSKREKVLEENKEDFDKYKTKVDSFEADLEEEVKAAKDKAMRKAAREVKVEADLLEKDMEGNEEVAALQIANLEGTIEEQKQQLEQLNGELKEALNRLQDLSSKALENNAK